MLKKNYSKTGSICRVTFKCNNPDGFERAIIAGDFNGWSVEESPMKKLKNGSFSVTLSLPTGNSYQFRYMFDGKTWNNDEAADSYVTNEFGDENSVVTV